MGYEPITYCRKCNEPFDVYHTRESQICVNCIERLVSNYRRAELGVDGNAAFALLGPDLQEGEAEFVMLPGGVKVNESEPAVIPVGDQAIVLSACKTALRNLRQRLGIDNLMYYFGPSHPYGR